MANYSGRYPNKYVSLSGKRTTLDLLGALSDNTYAIGSREYYEHGGVVYYDQSVNSGAGNKIATPRQEPLEISWKRALFEPK